jgi:membrane-bound metal-dependent hydrolase YbcI (DUF457 family)
MPLELSCGVAAGSTAPDWLEVPLWRNGARSSLIPHRTLTHWLTLWLLALMLALIAPQVPLVFLAQGFCLGGVLHVCLDVTTPMGVPIFFSRRRAPSWISACILVAATFFLIAHRPDAGLALDKAVAAQCAAAKDSLLLRQCLKKG